MLVFANKSKDKVIIDNEDSVMRKCIALLFLLANLCSPVMAESIIVFATVPGWPPSEYVNKEGKVEGFSIDYVRAAGKGAGFTPVFETVAREEILDGLASGLYDAVIASSLRVQDRMDEVAMSRPFSRTRQVLLVRKGTRFNTQEALRSARLGALSSSNGLALINEMEGVSAITYPDAKSAVNHLVAGKLDAFICDYPVAAYYSQSKLSNIIQITTFSVEVEPSIYTFAVNKGNREILEAIDKGIAAVKAKGIDRELMMQWKWR